jgi:hypothetical protein
MGSFYFLSHHMHFDFMGEPIKLNGANDIVVGNILYISKFFYHIFTINKKPL